LSPADPGTVIADRFPGAAVANDAFRGQAWSVVPTAVLIDVLRLLRDELGYEHLSDITAVDWMERSPRFDVVYQLFSFAEGSWYRVKVQVDEDDAVPTAIPVWPGANWAEREVYDLFGIRFEGHPALHRIMLPEGWVGHPLRKDYPMSQITLPRSHVTKMPE